MGNKRGSVLVIVGIVFLVLTASALSAGVYFYNFHVFKTIRLCVGESVNTGFACEDFQGCVDLAESKGVSFDLDGAPEFIRENLDAVLKDVVFCEGTCFVRKIRGFDFETQEFEMLESCEENEKEIVFDIHGKDAVEILEWLKSLDG